MPSRCASCYIVDERFDSLVSAIFHYFADFVRKSGGELQAHLNQIGPLLKRREYGAVLGIVDSM